MYFQLIVKFLVWCELFIEPIGFTQKNRFDFGLYNPISTNPAKLENQKVIQNNMTRIGFSLQLKSSFFVVNKKKSLRAETMMNYKTHEKEKVGGR